jgi:hypothetical protein
MLCTERADAERFEASGDPALSDTSNGRILSKSLEITAKAS